MDQADKLRSLMNQQNTSKNLARVITVTSGKGGVGKSNISVNLGITLSKMGKRVIIIDADFGLANVEVMLGIRPQYNLADLIYRGKNLTDIITNGPENIGFISGGSGIQELANLNKDQISLLIQRLVELDERADIIIIDTGAGISSSVLEFVEASSEVLLVTTPEPTSITDAYALLKALNRKEDFSLKEAKIKMIANRVSSREEGKDIHRKLSTVVSQFLEFNLDYLGSIPQDSTVSKSVIRQTPVVTLHPNCSFTRAIEEFGRVLCVEEGEVQPEKKGIAQLFTHLIKSKHRK